MAKPKFKAGDFVEIVGFSPTDQFAGEVCRYVGRRARVVGYEKIEPVAGRRELMVDSQPVGMGPWWQIYELKRVDSLGPSNDDIPEDELTLAELLQNAGARGLKSCQGARFSRLDGWGMNDGCYGNGETGKLQEPPAGAGACCALGAQLLVPPVTRPIKQYTGNDAKDDYVAPSGAVEGYLRDWNIGAAFEQALRPE